MKKLLRNNMKKLFYFVKNIKNSKLFIFSICLKLTMNEKSILNKNHSFYKG